MVGLRYNKYAKTNLQIVDSKKPTRLQFPQLENHFKKKNAPPKKKINKRVYAYYINIELLDLFGLISLFNCVSTFVDYLTQKPSL